MRLLPLLLLAAAPLAAQSTRPERTGFRETSSHADVLAFLDSLMVRGAPIRVGTLTESAEGRRVPYVVAARPMVSGPAEARRSGKPIVYLQGNIHAGEVEGKEAAQLLLRDLSFGALRPLLDSVVLVIVPIYNADGNDHMAAGELNRPGQNGPPIVGENTNGQGLNLNRDYVKMEAPETRASVALLAAWDPDLFIDLHTTNGSYHGYALTYAPGLNPNSSPVNDYVRDRFLPLVRARMRERHRLETFAYGNFRNQQKDSLAQGWETYDARPRFGTNWTGLRGRMAILSEGYSNADFRTRIDATAHFVREILSLVVEHRATIRSLILASDLRRPDSIVVRSVLGPPTEQDVIAEITESADDGSGGFARRRRTGVYRTIRMPVFDRFVAQRKEARPAVYLLPPSLAPLAAQLRRQGVLVERLSREWHGAVEGFALDTVLATATPFEGHRVVSVEGRWAAAADSAPQVRAGWYVVRTDQPLGTFAAYLLEPASEDGFVAWNFLDRDLHPHRRYPILRVREPMQVEMVEVE